MTRISLCHVILAVLGSGIAPLAAAHAQQPVGYEGYQVVHITVTGDADLDIVRDLQRLGRDFQVWSEVLACGLGPIEVRVAPAAQPALKSSGLAYTVAVADLQQHLDDLYAGQRGDFFSSLRTYDQHVQFMTDLAAAYPDLATMISLGLSVEGRNLWALRITAPTGGIKPGVLYHGAEHGNEQAPASIVAYVANQLLTGYGTDPEITELVNEVEWYLLPIMNVDGYVHYDRMNARYVDLNRNWGGPGSGQDPSGGLFPFSEPETKDLRDFLLAHPHVRVHVDLHGYVPWIMWAWAHIPDHCADHAQFAVLGAEFRNLVADAGGGGYEIGTIYDVAYPTSGCSTNYSYGVLDLWAFGIEVIDADMPEICEEFLSSLLMLGGWIGINDCNANGVLDGEEIAAGAGFDCNANGVLDQCECPGELNGDCVIDLSDLAELLSSYGQTAGASYYDGDIDGDGDVDLSDLGALLSVYGDICG